MAAGEMPVICSDLPSLAGLVEPGVNGLVFQAGDARALAAQARWAIDNADALDRLGRGAFESFEERYAPEANLRRLLEIYASVQEGRRRDDGIGLRSRSPRALPSLASSP